ncbi:MAG: hypothetical protein HY963_10945 [Ignavibacteriales bacterium]|nr:hypothetical protein [Ignavibacteriales bacterium]
MLAYVNSALAPFSLISYTEPFLTNQKKIILTEHSTIILNGALPNQFIIAPLRRLILRHAFVPLTLVKTSVKPFIVHSIIIFSAYIASLRRLVPRHAFIQLTLVFEPQQLKPLHIRHINILSPS